MPFRHSFIPDEYHINIRDYKYNSEDKSILYNYLFTHIANWCIKYTPTSVAPNIITILGLLCVLIPHLVLQLQYPNTFNSEISSTLVAMIGIFHLLYFNFDNMDGKQARKTGNSSPLGMLFDHQTDAIIVTLQSLNIGQVFMFGNTNFNVLLIFITGSVPFFTITLEEYYTHKMYLGVINGADEGCVGVGLLFIISAILGNNIWTNKLNEDLNIGQLVLYLFFIAAIITALINFYSIIKHNFKILQIIQSNIVLLYLYFSCFCFYWFSSPQIYQQHIIVVVYIVGLNFAKLVGVLQLSHIMNTYFNQFRKSIMFIISVMNLLLVINSNIRLDDQTKHKWISLCYYVLLVLSILAYLHFIVNVALQMSEILDIRIFFNKNQQKGLEEIAKTDENSKDFQIIVDQTQLLNV